MRLYCKLYWSLKFNRLAFVSQLKSLKSNILQETRSTHDLLEDRTLSENVWVGELTEDLQNIARSENTQKALGDNAG